MNWPAGTPTNLILQLTTLTHNNKLSGIPPQILAAICGYTSNWGLTGLGINATGFGGYFGQHVGWAYPGRPQGFSDIQLVSPATFPTQAMVAAATLASYKLPLRNALAKYVSGDPADIYNGFVIYVLGSTNVNTYMASLPKGIEPMSVTINTGIIAVTGVSHGHKFLFTAVVGQRSTATDWSIMDLTDAADLQKVVLATDFTS